MPSEQGSGGADPRWLHYAQAREIIEHCCQPMMKMKNEVEEED
jgi:hypothetical protein